MPNNDFMVERRMLAYMTLLLGNLEATREFVEEYANKLPFSPQFLLDFTFRAKSLENKCDYTGRKLIEKLSIGHSTLEVFDETSRF